MFYCILLDKFWYFISISTGNLSDLLEVFIQIYHFILYDSILILRICLIKEEEYYYNSFWLVQLRMPSQIAWREMEPLMYR